MDADFASGRAPGFSRHECGTLFRLGAAGSMAAARALVTWLWRTQPHSCLVVVVEHGVWPSSENLSLYYAWRRSLHVMSTLDDAPAHEFLPFEIDEMVSLVQLSLIFGWGIVGVSADGTAAFAIDDDAVVRAFAQRAEHAADLTALLPDGLVPHVKPTQ